MHYIIKNNLQSVINEHYKLQKTIPMSNNTGEGTFEKSSTNIFPIFWQEHE